MLVEYSYISIYITGMSDYSLSQRDSLWYIIYLISVFMHVVASHTLFGSYLCTWTERESHHVGVLTQLASFSTTPFPWANSVSQVISFLLVFFSISEYHNLAPLSYFSSLLGFSKIVYILFFFNVAGFKFLSSEVGSV